MPKRFAVAAAVAAVGIFAFVMSTPSQAKDNPGGGPAGCVEDPDSDQGGDSTLYYCCYDDGCWICDWKNGLNCTWDPAYGTRSEGRLRLPRNIKRPDIFQPPVKPPRSQPPKLGPLETSPGSPSQGPSAPGTPTKPTAPPAILR